MEYKMEYKLKTNPTNRKDIKNTVNKRSNRK